MPDNDAAIARLHRYFIWPGEMRRSFEMTAASKPQPLERASEESIRAFMYLSLFHFQRDYLDDRLIAFMEKKESVVWVRSLHEAFSRWFLSWLESRRSRGR